MFTLGQNTMLVKISKVAAMRNSMFAASHGDGAGKDACAGTKQNKTKQT
jgi:hypothetical protein